MNWRFILNGLIGGEGGYVNRYSLIVIGEAERKKKEKRKKKKGKRKEKRGKLEPVVICSILLPFNNNHGPFRRTSFPEAITKYNFQYAQKMPL